MRVSRFSLVAFLLMSLPATADTAMRSNIPNLAYARAVSTVFGFCLGQEVSIRALKNGNEDLHYLAAGHVLGFHAASGFVCKTAEKELREILPPQQYQADLEKIIEMLPLSETDILPRDKAEGFVADLETRADIKNLLPIYRSPMLYVRYAGMPDREFADGFVTDYNIKSEPKALGLDLQLTLPMSWYAEPGDRPHIVQRWKNVAPEGFNMILVIVQNLGEDIVEAEIDWLVEGQRGDELAPSPSWQVTEIAKTYIETIPTIAYETRGSQERAGIELFLAAHSYLLTYNGIAISLQCQSGDEVSKVASVEERFKRIQFLCQQVANSMVLMDRYR